MIRALTVILLLLPAIASADDQSLPDRQLTPGAVLELVPASAAKCLSDAMATAINAGDPVTLEMICTTGYTKCVRRLSPSARKKVFASYGLERNHTGYCDTKQGCEVDHLIALEIGGSNDRKNLWPQPYQGTDWNAHKKDQLEFWLHTEVCAGRMSLTQAQEEISTDWVESYRKHLTK